MANSGAPSSVSVAINDLSPICTRTRACAEKPSARQTGQSGCM